MAEILHADDVEFLKCCGMILERDTDVCPCCGRWCHQLPPFTD